MKRLFTLLCIAILGMGTMFAKSDKQIVVFNVDLHCQGCIAKIEKNIAFEKGVKDLQCDLQKKQVTVTYDASKTSIEQLQKAFEQLKKPATVNAMATIAANKAANTKSPVTEHPGTMQPANE